MGSELVIVRWCDRCKGKGDDVAEHRVRVDDVDRQLDLCSVCFEAVLVAVVEAITSLGQPADKVTSPTRAAATSTGRPMGRPRGRGAATPESQRALLENHPDALACPACLVLFTPGKPGTSRLKYVSSHLQRQHDKRTADYTDAQYAEADALARARLKVTS